MPPNILRFLPPRWAIGLAVVPLAIPVTYLLYLDGVVKRQTTATTGIRNSKKRNGAAIPPTARRPVTLPAEVESDDAGWVLAYERVVSEPVRPSSLLAPADGQRTVEAGAGAGAGADLRAVVTSYVRATMTAFSWTPQAFVLWASAGEGEVRQTFESGFIRRLEFRDGERVNGFWRVVYRGDGGVPGHERVELALSAPAAYRGPVVRGVVVAGVEAQEDGSLAFVNETWMWRKQSEAPVLLERAAGQWLHALLSGWLVLKGIRAVTEAKEKAV